MFIKSINKESGLTNIIENYSNYLEKSCICGVKVQDELRSIQNKLVLNGISFKKGIEKKVFWSKNASKFFSGLFVPNVMSVGASMDGMKYFLPKGTMLKTYQLSIYSTYGKLLWSSDKLEQGQPVEFWDGSLNGEPLAQDVYVWKIQATFEDGSVWRGMCDDAGRCSNVGTITILR